MENKIPMKRRHFLHIAGASALLAAALPARSENSMSQTAANALTYPLDEGGWIHHFLIAGPQYTVIPDGEYKFNPELRPPVVQKMRRPPSEVTGTPVEGDALTVDGDALVWHYVSCDDDHLIDVTTFQGKSRYVRAWAYADLESTLEQTAELHFFTNGPADVWLNDTHIARNEAFDYLNPHESQAVLPLKKGPNRLLIRFEQAATRNSLTTLAARVDKIVSDSVTVHLPTHTTDVKTRQAWESAFERVYLSRDHYTPTTPGDEIQVMVPALSGVPGEVTLELRPASGAKSGDAPLRRAVWKADGSALVSLGKADGVPPGEYHVLLTTPGLNPSRRELPFLLSNGDFCSTPATAPFDTFAARKAYLLSRFAKMPQTGDGWGGLGIFPMAARIEIGNAKEANFAAFENIVDGVNTRRDGSDFAMSEILHYFVRFGGMAAFPQALRAKTRACILDFKYWSDEPSSVSMTFGSENHQMAFHTAEILAGQLYPNEVFTNNKQTGAWHKAHGEQKAETWLQRRVAYGMDEWDSDGYYEADIKILSVFIDNVQNPGSAKNGDGGTG